jgi:hypothetical protein
MKQPVVSSHPGQAVQASRRRRGLQLSASSQASRASGQSAAAAELPEILAAIRRHEVLRSSLKDSGATRRWAAAEMAAFLGSDAVDTVFQNVSPDCGNLLPQLHPVLSLFLGRRAAGLLESRLVASVLVRI